MINVCLINLGCAKNLVDSEAILALFDKDSRFKITIDEDEADVLILNTCAFIFDAENESFETIEELSKLNKKLVVLGCLVEKYKNELKKKFPKVNLFAGFKDFYRLPELLGNLLNENINKHYVIASGCQSSAAMRFDENLWDLHHLHHAIILMDMLVELGVFGYGALRA